jgi:hypothetical protein
MMKRMFYRQRAWILLLLLGLVFLLATPVSAASQVQQQRRATTTNLPASVYIAMDSLQSMFQDQINQQVANLSASTMNGMLGSLPAADQGWARAMAGALIQPSATLTQLTPQSDGLNTQLSLSLYPGDPKPINAAMLVTFGVRDASTIQVNAQPVAGSPQLANGPLTTLAVPIGQLESINTTPNCGNVGLKTDILVPVTVASTGGQNQNNQFAQSTSPVNQTLAYTQRSQMTSYKAQKRAATTANAFVEITNSSLNALGSAMGPLNIGKITIVPWDPNDPLTAENIQINTQGTGLWITADIYVQQKIGHNKIATAVAVAQPSAVNGQLVMTITSLQVKVFGLISLPPSATASYKTQLQDMLNSNLGAALAGQFTVNSVSIGGAVACAASNSLILQGTTSLG